MLNEKESLSTSIRKGTSQSKPQLFPTTKVIKDLEKSYDKGKFVHLDAADKAMLNDIKKASPTSLEGDAVSETTPQLSATGKPAQDFIGDVPNAKVNITSENKKGIVKNLQVLTKICQEDDVSATDFLNKLREVLSIGEKAGTSYLRQDMEDDRHSLRIADHSINAKNNNNGKDKKNFDSLVIKVAKRSHFTPANDVELVEYVFYPKLLTKEKQLDIVDGINKWLENGVFTAKADRVNVSPNPSTVQKLVVSKGKTQFLKTPKGEVHGFVKDGKIYLDPTLPYPTLPYSTRAPPSMSTAIFGMLYYRKRIRNYGSMENLC